MPARDPRVRLLSGRLAIAERWRPGDPATIALRDELREAQATAAIRRHADHLTRAVADRVAAERAAQGLPEHVTDDAILAMVAEHVTDVLAAAAPGREGGDDG